MNTIFSQNITTDEREKLGIPFDVDTEYLKYADDSTIILHLALLYNLRGETEKATSIAEKLPINMKNNFARTIDHS